MPGVENLTVISKMRNENAFKLLLLAKKINLCNCRGLNLQFMLIKLTMTPCLSTPIS